MSGFREGAPCWADVSLSDVPAGQRFYSELFGWSYADRGAEFDHYQMALRDGRYAAGLMETMDAAMPNAWTVYFASPDIAGAADRIKAAGGSIVFGPEVFSDIGVGLGALDPGGSFFGVWQGGTHTGFGRVDVPGTYCWTENHTLDAAAVDPFYEEVFGFESRQIGDGAGFDYKVWSLPGEDGQPGEGGTGGARGGVPVGGRMQRGGDLPAEAPSRFQTYFAVEDCDAAAATVRRLGGSVLHEPHDSPFGRTALVVDDQGASFSVIDLRRTTPAAP